MYMMQLTGVAHVSTYSMHRNIKKFMSPEKPPEHTAHTVCGFQRTCD
jgi:hypothetical protein